MRFALANPNAYQLVFCSPGLGISEERSEALADLGARCYALFLGAVEEIAKAGRLKPADADLAAQTTWAATHGLVALLIMRPKFDWADPEVLIAYMLDSLFDGLVARTN